MKTKIHAIDGSVKGEIELPKQFEETVRQDLILRAVLAIQANKRQRYGANTRAGKRSSSTLSRRRHDYKGSYGHGISRVPRKIMSRSGTQFNWVGAFMPGTVGGRRAHPPKAEKTWDQKINNKERRKAIRCAISASMDIELVNARGHRTKVTPIVLDDESETIEKTHAIKKTLLALHLAEELERIGIKKIRAGKGKARSRRYQVKRGPLVIVSKKCPLIDAISNVKGVDVTEVRNLNAELLAPGRVGGRLTIWTESAIKKLGDENLFM